MIKIKLGKNKLGKIIFKLKITKEYEDSKLFKIAIMQSKIIKGRAMYNYEVPLRFFFPIYSNCNKDDIVIDKYSLNSYLEFSDCFDEKYYMETEATPKFMKKWREEGCPNIYKISIDMDTKEIKKEIAFKKPRINIRSN